MIYTIAKRELTEMYRDGRLKYLGSMVVLLLLVALAVGWQHQFSVNEEREAAQLLDYSDWLAQSERHPHDAAHQGMHVFKPEPPLSVLDTGISPYVGSTQWLRAHRQSDVKFLPAQDSSGLQRFGQLSVAWVLQHLGPLLVIVLGFGAFAVEREQGTLRLMMSMGIAPRRLLAGKALGLAAGVMLVLLPTLLAGAIALAWNLDENVSTADLALRYFLFALAYFIYLGIYLFITLAVSAKVQSSKIALLLLLGIWIVGVVVAPRAMADIADQVYPTPSRVEFNQQLDGQLNDAYRQAWQSAFGVEQRWGQDLPLSKWGHALQVDDEAGYKVTEEQFQQLWSNFGKQQTLQELSGLVFPVLAIRSLSMTLSDTSFAAHERFSTAAETHRRLIQDMISHDLIEHADPLGNAHFTYKASPELWATVPPFEYEPAPLTQILPAVARSMAVLLALLLVSIVAAWRATPTKI